MTIEAATGIASLVVVLLMVLAAMTAVLVQVRCVDAAAEAVRLAARDDLPGARRAATALLPPGSEVALEVREDVVVARVRAAPLGSALPDLRVGADTTAAREPGPVPADTATDEPDGSAASPDVAPTGVAPEAPTDPAPERPP